MFRKTLAATVIVAVTATGALWAESHANQAAMAAIKARQAQMQLYSFNLGVLGAMAKGDVDYDAGAATGAAENLAALSKLNQAAYWPQGSDADSVEGTRALPAMWQNFPDVMEKGQALAAAADGMVTAAGTDLEALRGQIGAVGGACAACHKAYRAPNN